MFHAVSQIGADDDDLISPGIESTTLPMFRESGPTSKRSRGGGNRVAPRGAVVGPREGMPPLRHGKRDLRSRRSASIEMTATNQKFTAPVASSSCFEDPGTFRWDRTATAENTEHHDDERTTEDDRGDDEVQPRGVGLPLRQRRPGMRFRPPPPELENNSARKPWYIIVPDSRTHQLLDHLGEEALSLVNIDTRESFDGCNHSNAIPCKLIIIFAQGCREFLSASDFVLDVEFHFLKATVASSIPHICS